MRVNQPRGPTQTVALRLRPIVGRQLVMLAIVGLAFWLLRARLPLVDIDEVWQAVSQVSPLSWLGATCATVASFWAVGRYDCVVHGLLGTGVSSARARLSGTVAIAVAQFAGFGVLSGALAPA